MQKLGKTKKAMNQINTAIYLLKKIKIIMLFQITLPICPILYNKIKPDKTRIPVEA
jgi:hypothetical protein